MNIICLQVYIFLSLCPFSALLNHMTFIIIIIVIIIIIIIIIIIMNLRKEGKKPVIPYKYKNNFNN